MEPLPAKTNDHTEGNTYAILYRGVPLSGIFIAASSPSEKEAQDIANTLTATTGVPHWVDPMSEIEQTEGSNRVYWKEESFR